MTRQDDEQQKHTASEEISEPTPEASERTEKAAAESDPPQPPDPPEKSGSSQESETAGQQPAEGSLREQLEAARADRDDHREKWLRAEAELENYRKRVRREVDEFRKYQSLGLARDLLPVLDNLKRAVEAAEQAENVRELLQGVQMVLQQFTEVLARHDIKPIEAVGHPFDPNLHEAVQQIPTAEHPPLTVLRELETGYTLHDRVIRPSKVIVAAAPEKPEETEAASS